MTLKCHECDISATQNYKSVSEIYRYEQRLPYIKHQHSLTIPELRRKNAIMTFSSIAPEILVKSYYDSFREDPELGVQRIMLMMIYDDREAKWAHKFLQKVGVLEKSSDKKEQKAQLRKIHRLRSQVADMCGLPIRGKRGATQEYRSALAALRAINPRPSEDQLLAGWMPQPLVEPANVQQKPVDPDPTKAVDPKHAAAVTKETPPAPAKKKGELPTDDWGALAEETAQNSRTFVAPPPLKETPPKYRSPSLPTNVLKMTTDEQAAYKSQCERAVEKYIAELEGTKWIMGSDWKGEGDPDKFAVLK